MELIKREMALRRIRAVADYQFGKDVGKALFPDNVILSFSKTTGRVRHVWLDDKLLATFRPTNGMLALTIEGGKRLLKVVPRPGFRVVVSDDVRDEIARGKDVFVKHVIDADLEIRPQGEVIVTDKRDGILAVGKAILTGKEMLAFKYGVAVKVRASIRG